MHNRLLFYTTGTAPADDDAVEQPLQAVPLAALDRLPPSQSSLLFANARSISAAFGRRHWKPGSNEAGFEPLRRLYDLRHTYATFALRAGLSVFAVSRFVGSSIAMIDRHYGHRRSRRHGGEPTLPRPRLSWPLPGRRARPHCATSSSSATAIST